MPEKLIAGPRSMAGRHRARLPKPAHAMSARFVFAVAQAGAERPLKNEIAREHPELRFAFSRPGFVTFRAPETVRDDFRAAQRVRAHLGRLARQGRRRDDDGTLARDAWQLVGAELAGRVPSAHLHVWQRERPLPGDEDFDGSAGELARAIGALLVERLHRTLAEPPAVNAEAAAGELVLDCVLVERHEWWLGWHRAAAPETRWPGGVPQIAIPVPLISRAYLKIVEALRWSELPIAAGDRCVEIGSSPGGSCLALLERGLLVTGIDPAEMDPAVLAHPASRTFARAPRTSNAACFAIAAGSSWTRTSRRTTRSIRSTAC